MVNPISSLLRKKDFLIPLLIILFSFILHYLYYQHAPGVHVSEDTYSYYLSGEQIIRNKTLVHYFRTPVYPLFLHSVMAVTGYPLETMLTKPFFDKMIYVLFIQSILISLANVLLYLSLKKIKIPSLISLLFILFISADIIIFSWFRQLLTEAPAVFFLTLIFYLTVTTLKKPRLALFILLLIVSVLSSMLRPSFLLIPFISLFTVSLYHRNKKIYYFSAVILVIHFSLISLYTKINLNQNGINGLTAVSTVNSFGKVLSLNLNIENAKEYPFYYEKVKDYRSKNLSPHPYRFLEHYNLINYGSSPSKIREMKAFSDKVIFTNMSVYLLKGSAEIPSALLDVSDKIILTPATESFPAFLFNSLYAFYKKSQYLFFLILPLAPLVSLRFLTHKNITIAVLFFLAAVSLYHILTSVYLSYDEFGRLMVPAQPLMYLSVFLPVYFIWKRSDL